MLSHNVFFTLKDKSAAAQDKLLADCRKFLSAHSGTAFFACGKVSDLNRPVNVRDFDVALHVTFETREAHDQYQAAPLHLEFVEANKENWTQVRVFDSEG